jgi:cell division protein FtsB
MSRKQRMWLVIGAVGTVGLLFVAVFPARTYLDQHHRRQAVEARIKVTEERNKALQHRIDTLHTDAEVERLAREQYNLVRPGEEAYAILPSRRAPTADPASKTKANAKAGWVDRTWHSITSIF